MIDHVSACLIARTRPCAAVARAFPNSSLGLSLGGFMRSFPSFFLGLCMGGFIAIQTTDRFRVSPPQMKENYVVGINNMKLLILYLLIILILLFHCFISCCWWTTKYFSRSRTWPQQTTHRPNRQMAKQARITCGNIPKQNNKTTNLNIKSWTPQNRVCCATF